MYYILFHKKEGEVFNSKRENILISFFGAIILSVCYDVISN